MRKMIFTLFCLLSGTAFLTGCGGNDEPFVAKNYISEENTISGISIAVRDRQVEITASADNLIHIDYYENSKEYYEFSVSGDNVLTMTSASNKEWTDFIGGKASADVRKISVQLPDALLNSLEVSTTNENISIAPLNVNGTVSLSANGGNISFDKLDIQTEITLNVKNGNISGVLSGSYDDYAISCSIKKGESNLPTKESGSKKLTVTANNGDVKVEIQ